MATVRIVATVVPFSAPTGTVAGQYSITLTNQADNTVQTVASATPDATFPNVTPGNYQASVALLDNQGSAIGPVPAVAFTVPVVGPVTVSVPSVISVTIS